MFCTQCGARNDESALHCTQCGANLREPQPEPQVEPQEDPESMATRRLTIADLGLMNLPPASPAAPASEPAGAAPAPAAAPPASASSGATAASASVPTYGSVPLSAPPATARISSGSVAIPPPSAPDASPGFPPPPAFTPPSAAPTAYSAPGDPGAPGVMGAYAPPSDPPFVPVENQFGMPVQTVPNYMVQSILLTLCCCLPFGIVAIVFASQVNSKLAAGDVSGAVAASGKARLFCWIGLAAGIAFAIFFGIFRGLATYRMMNH